MTKCCYQLQRVVYCPDDERGVTAKQEPLHEPSCQIHWETLKRELPLEHCRRHRYNCQTLQRLSVALLNPYSKAKVSFYLQTWFGGKMVVVGEQLD